MTLARQIGLLVSALFLAAFSAAFLVNLENTRNYLHAQLESHAQDTATSLGLSLSPHSTGSDTLLMESMVDAIFDRGYYRRIVVESADGNRLVARELPVKVHGVPGWFVTAFPLDPPSASANLMAGWRRGGEVRVTSHPGFAHAELWNVAQGLAAWSLGALAVAMLLTGGLLRIVLRPLRAVERQALAIAEREFPVVEDVPTTRELRRVVIAMNRMATKVQQMLAEQQARVEELRHAAYVDRLTGLGNAQAFARDLERMTTLSEQHAFGAVIQLKALGLDRINREHGAEAADDWLRRVADGVREIMGGRDGETARITGALFALIVPDATRSEARDLCAALVGRLAGVSIGDAAPTGVNAGLAYFGGGQTPDQLLERVGDALANAEASGPNEWHMYDATETAGGRDTAHEDRWRAILQRVVDGRGIVLLYQPVLESGSGALIHEEALARIRPGDGDLVPASIFFPMAVRVGMAPALDRLVVETAMARAVADERAYIAINLARASVEDEAFTGWLVERLEAAPGAARRLAFEVAEQTVTGSAAAFAALAGRLRGAGAGVGVDHCGARDLALGYLRDIRTDYVKIDGAFITGIESDDEKRRYVRSLVELCRLLDTRSVAEYVESAERLEAVEALGVDGVQGRHVGEAVER